MLLVPCRVKERNQTVICNIYVNLFYRRSALYRGVYFIIIESVSFGSRGYNFIPEIATVNLLFFRFSKGSTTTLPFSLLNQKNAKHIYLTLHQSYSQIYDFHAPLIRVQFNRLYKM